MNEQKGLKRRSEFTPTVHADCTFGRVVALYIFQKKKWRKIGEVCKGCAEVALYPEFLADAPHRNKE